MSNWLNKPYPKLESKSIQASLSFGVGVSCFLFLTVFQPFGLDRVGSVTYLAGFGLNAMLSLLFHYFVLPKIWPSAFDPNRWTTRHEMTLLLSVILLISLFNWIYNSHVGQHISPQYNLLEFVFMTSAVGVMPIFMIVWVNEIIARQKNTQLGATLMQQSEKTEAIVPTKLISIKSDNAKEKALEIKAQQFAYATSGGNYCEVFYYDNNSVNKALLRLSLKALESQLSDEQNIVRCHKSYLVNLKHVIRSEGNARALVLHLDQVDNTVPVSRSFDRSLIQ